MTEFEYLSVLISIIFGLALTQIMSGAVRSLYTGEMNENQVVYTLFAIVVFVLNWWVSFSWNLNPQWSFGTFLILVLWAMTHYGMAAAMYPPATTKSWTFERRRRYFLAAFIGTCILDIMSTATRGALFTPWYYLPFIAHLIVVSGIGVYFDTNRVHRIVAWWLLITIASWSLLVRTLLSELV